MKTAVIVLGHGSRSAGSDKAVQAVVAAMKKGGSTIIEHAFLQYVPPTPREALERCARQNAGRIVIVPFFLQAGAHVTRDIPALVDEARKTYPGIEIVVTDYVGTHPLMVKIVEDLVNKDNCGVRTSS